jgi:hypothetical protein
MKMGNIPTRRKFSFTFNRAFHLIFITRTAAQTVFVSIGLLCVMGVICSLTTKNLHRIVIWFAPINSKL